MNKNNISTKNLFNMQVNDCNIIIFCAYNNKTDHVGIRTQTKKYYKHKEYSKYEHEFSRYKSVCSTLKEHAKLLDGDLERLSSEFILKIIGDGKNEDK